MPVLKLGVLNFLLDFLGFKLSQLHVDINEAADPVKKGAFIDEIRLNWMPTFQDVMLDQLLLGDSDFNRWDTVVKAFRNRDAEPVLGFEIGVGFAKGVREILFRRVIGPLCLDESGVVVADS